MRLQFICSGLITNIFKAGAASRLGRWQQTLPAGTIIGSRRKLRALCFGKSFFIYFFFFFWQAAQVCIQFNEHIWCVYISKFGPSGSAANLWQKKDGTERSQPSSDPPKQTSSFANHYESKMKSHWQTRPFIYEVAPYAKDIPLLMACSPLQDPQTKIKDALSWPPLFSCVYSSYNKILQNIQVSYVMKLADGFNFPLGQ